MSTRRYAQNTQVPVDRSRAELESLLQKHGATQRVSWSNAHAAHQQEPKKP